MNIRKKRKDFQNSPALLLETIVFYAEFGLIGLFSGLGWLCRKTIVPLRDRIQQHFY